MAANIRPGPGPARASASVARSTARMSVVRRPPSSSAAMPAIVVPPGARHHVLQRARVQAGLGQQLRGAEHGLGGERHRRRAVEPHLHAAVGERLDDDGHVGGPGAARARSPRPSASSSSTTTRPTAPKISSAVSRSSGPSPWPSAMAVAPCSTSAGVFGITRMRRASLPSAARIVAVDTPAAIEMSRCWRGDGRRDLAPARRP